jgi:hypothetical protein
MGELEIQTKNIKRLKSGNPNKTIIKVILNKTRLDKLK